MESWFAYAHGDGMAQPCEELLYNATPAPTAWYPTPDDDGYPAWRRNYIGCLGVTWERIEAQMFWSLYTWLAFIVASWVLHRLLVFARPRRRGGGWDRPAWVYQWVGTTDCPPSNSRIEKFLQVSESNAPAPPLSEHVPARVPVVKRARGSRRAVSPRTRRGRASRASSSSCCGFRRRTR